MVATVAAAGEEVARQLVVLERLGRAAGGHERETNHDGRGDEQEGREDRGGASGHDPLAVLARPECVRMCHFSVQARLGRGRPQAAAQSSNEAEPPL